MHSTRTWISSPFGPFCRTSYRVQIAYHEEIFNTVMLKWTYSLSNPLRSFRRRQNRERLLFRLKIYGSAQYRDVGRTRGFQSRQHGTKGFKTRKNEKPPPPSRRSGIYYCNIEDLDEENELMIKWCGATFYQMARTKETRVQHPPFISVFQPHFRFISSIRPAYPDAGWFIFLAAPASTVFYLRIESIYVLPLLWRVSCLKSQR